MADRRAAWLLMAVDAGDRQFGGNDGYTDQPDVFYSWDDRVPRCRDVHKNDLVVLWDKHALLGLSVVEQIIGGEAPKTIYRWITEGHIPESAVIRFGERSIRLDRYELDRVIETNGELRRWASRAS